MARSFKTQLSGQIGEHLVVAELGRLGIIATPFSGNVPDIDVLAYRDGKSVPLQVKAQKSGHVSVDAKKYLKISFNGDVQSVVGKSKDIDRNLIFVLVKIGEKSSEDKFYIFRQGVVQDIIYNNHKSFLEKHNGVRPKNPKSTHVAYGEEDLAVSENDWSVIIDEFLKV
jgi:hypothetical protein